MNYIRFFSTHSPITSKKYLSLRRDDLEKILQQYNEKLANIDTLQSTTVGDVIIKTNKTITNKDDNGLSEIQLKELNRQRLWFNLSRRLSQRRSFIEDNATANKSYDLMIDGVPNYPIE